jgi:hypothetical protein
MRITHRTGGASWGDSGAKSSLAISSLRKVNKFLSLSQLRFPGEGGFCERFVGINQEMAFCVSLLSTSGEQLIIPYVAMRFQSSCTAPLELPQRCELPYVHSNDEACRRAESRYKEN